jgi:diguanylate cyclase (GGDEF)-like protein
VTGRSKPDAAGSAWRWRISHKLLVLIVVPLALLLVLAGSLTRLALDTRSAAVAAQRSNQALQSAQELLTTLVDAETGMRGYVLTGDPLFTDPYRAARSSFAHRIAVLNDASQDDPKIRADVGQVVRRAHLSFATIDRYVRLVERGKVRSARAAVATGYAKQIMDAFRAAVSVYESAERGREATTEAAFATTWARMYALLIGGSLALVATTIVLYLVTSRSITTRLQRLQRNANALAQGAPADTDGCDDESKDEVTQLECSFHEMADLLRERETALVRTNSLQRAILDATDHAIITTGIDGIVTSFNGGAERMLGYAATKVIGRFSLDAFFMPQELRAEVPEAERDAADTADTTDTRKPTFDRLVAKALRDRVERREWTLVRSDGAHVPVAATITRLQDDGGTTFGFLDVSSDISERKAAERALIASESEQREYASQLRSLYRIANTVSGPQNDPIERSLLLGLEELGLECAYVGTLAADRATIVIENAVCVNDALEIVPLVIDSQIPVRAAFLGAPSPDSDVYAVENLTAMREPLPEGHAFGNARAYISAPIYISGILAGAIGFIAPKPRDKPLSASNRAFVRAIADLIGAVIVRSKQRAELDALAFFDALTDLPNRVLLLDRLKQCVRSANRYNETFALLFLDLDGFKEVNDRHGHGVGDNMLIAVARRFEKCTRTSDTVARLGGDEFVILAPKIDSALPAEQLALRIIESTRRPIVIAQVEHAMTVSIGIAIFAHDGAGAESLLESADRALYLAKAGGKNTYRFASEPASRAAPAPSGAVVAP